MNARSHVLFVCSQNRWRSLTAEKIFQNLSNCDVRSAGTDPGARVRVTAGHIGWADLIFVMEKKHQQILGSKYEDILSGKRVVCLHIPDDFQFMDRELIELLVQRLSEHLDLSDLAELEG